MTPNEMGFRQLEIKISLDPRERNGRNERPSLAIHGVNVERVTEQFMRVLERKVSPVGM